MGTVDKTSSADRVSTRTWTLAGVGIAGSAIVLLLLLLHRGAIERAATDSRSERGRLDRIVAMLQETVSGLDEGRAALFGEGAAQTIVDTESLHRLLALTHDVEYSQQAHSRIRALRSALVAVRVHLEHCAEWRSESMPTLRQQQSAKDQAEAAMLRINERIDELLRERLSLPCQHAPDQGPALPPAEAALLRLRDGLHELARLSLWVEHERQERRVRDLREHQIPRALHAASTALAALRTALGDAAVAPLLIACEAVQHEVLGAEGSAGLIDARLASLRHAAHGAELEAGLRQAITSLRATQLDLERCATAAVATGLGAAQEHTQRLLLLALVVSIAATALLAWLARALHRRATRQIQQLAALRKSAEDALHAQSMFVASMSHEIRTPMNGVLGMAEMLESSPLGFEQKQVARTIRSSAEALLTVINDVLDFSKIQAGKLELDAADFDLRNTVQDAIDLVRHMASRKGIEIFSHIAHPVLRHVRGDSDRLRQVLINLCGNAVKFTDAGHVTLLVEALARRDDVVQLQFSVTDTGIGIPAAAQERLFEPFNQGNPSATRRFGGTGLGLTISKRLVQMMRGDISVVSTPGIGSTFTFTVMLQPARGATPKEEPCDLSGQAALVVARSDEEGEALAEQLARCRTGFDFTSNALEALELLRAARRHGHRFDVALIDLDHGDAALEIARRIADDAELAPTRCVALTRRGEEPADGSLRPLHLHGWLAMPATGAELKECLQTVLELAPAAPHAAPEAPVDEDDEPLGHHVLVAEDDPINQRVLEQMLERLGCTAEFAANGRLAVDKMVSGDFEVVLMDCQMPEMDGLAATEHIRDLNGPKHLVPIIALSAAVLPADRRACQTAGMNDFLSKPFKKRELREVITKWAGVAAPRG